MFQNKNVLLELIRGFKRIPESNGMEIGLGLISLDDRELNEISVKTFIEYLGNSNPYFLGLPKGKYKLSTIDHDDIPLIVHPFIQNQ